MRSLFVVFFALWLGACASTPGITPTNLDIYGERFVRLALDLGEHDEDYVDAYHGPEQWRRDAANEAVPLKTIRRAAERAGKALRAARQSDARSERRRIYLARQYEALAFRARMVMGETFSFDQQSRGLYDAVAPRHDAAFFQTVLDELDILLPGRGDVAKRYATFRKNFVIPPEQLDTVFRAAITECARRTAARLTLPTNQSFKIEYVKDKSWGAYNWYQGDATSLIQVNTDLPIHIDRAIDLACHEGYPGHHVYNALMEKHLLNDRGWIEFSVLPLFSPTGLIAEGTANYGIVMAFPGNERVAFERNKLFALAGLDQSEATLYYDIEGLVEQLSYAGNEAARRYIDEEIDAQEAAAWLGRYALMSPERALQRVEFIDQYGAYVINYNLGRDLVTAYVERAGEEPADRWARFERLLSTPVLPSQLVPAR